MGKEVIILLYCYFCNMALDYPYFSSMVIRINFSTSLLISQLIIWFAILSSSPWLKGDWASLIAQLVNNLPAIQETRVHSWVRKITWRRDRLPTPGFLGFPRGSAGKESTCNAGDPGLLPGLGRSPEEGKSYPLQYSGLENSTGLQRVR